MYVPEFVALGTLGGADLESKRVRPFQEGLLEVRPAVCISASVPGLGAQGVGSEGVWRLSCSGI